MRRKEKIKLIVIVHLCRKVFKQREAFERIINESEDRTTKVSSPVGRSVRSSSFTFRATSSTGRAGLGTWNSRTLTASPSTLRCTTPTSDRFTISTE